MDVVIALSQGLGLAVAAGLLASAPLALAATAATEGWLRGPIGLADDGVTVAVTWALVVVELASGDDIPYVGLAVGAAAAAGVAIAMRTLRSRAVKGGGDLRGTALIEDGAGLGTAAIAVVPFAGYVLAVAAAALLQRVRVREARKYEGLRVLR